MVHTTGYDLIDYGFDGTDIGIDTYSSFNYLNAIAGLASEAANRGLHGDIVYLYFNFMYAGQPKSTALSASSDMVMTMASELINSSVNKKRAIQLTESLGNSSSIPEIQSLYAELLPAADTHKKRNSWVKEACSTAHKPSKNACRALLSAIKVDGAWKTGGPRAIQYGDCFVSWNSNASFYVEDLYNAGNYCYNLCVGVSISCEVWGADLNGKIVDQCISNRANGCT